MGTPITAPTSCCCPCAPPAPPTQTPPSDGPPSPPPSSGAAHQATDAPGPATFEQLGPDKYRIPRTAADDPARASAFLQTTMQATSGIASIEDALAAGYTMNEKNRAKYEAGTLTHLHMWHKENRADQNVDPNRPDALMFSVDAASGEKLIGAVFATNRHDNPDIGLGTWHVHHSTSNDIRMKHIWFTPDDLATAFNDSPPRGHAAGHESADAA